MADLNIKNISFDQLKGLPLKDLLVLQESLNEAVEVRRKTEKKELLEKMKVLATESGYSLDELLGEENKKNPVKKKAPAKYINPDNGKTWSGRGMKPIWLKDFINSGRKLEEFEIQ